MQFPLKFSGALFAGVAFILLGTFVSPPVAIAYEGVSFHLAPPRPRIEEVPPPRPGFVWSPGYWDIRNNRHAWQQGHFERVRRGQRYEAPSWSQHEKRWELHYGRWNKSEVSSGNEARHLTAITHTK